MATVTTPVESVARELMKAVPAGLKGHVRRLSEEIVALRQSRDSLSRAVEEIESTLHAMRDGIPVDKSGT